MCKMNLGFYKMSRFKNPFLSLSAPLLILIAIFVFFNRNGTDKIQSLPAFLVGLGLIISNLVYRKRHRKRLLMEINAKEKV